MQISTNRYTAYYLFLVCITVYCFFWISFFQIFYISERHLYKTVRACLDWFVCIANFCVSVFVLWK